MDKELKEQKKEAEEEVPAATERAIEPQPRKHNSKRKKQAKLSLRELKMNLTLTRNSYLITLRQIGAIL